MEDGGGLDDKSWLSEKDALSSIFDPLSSIHGPRSSLSSGGVGKRHPCVLTAMLKRPMDRTQGGSVSRRASRTPIFTICSEGTNESSRVPTTSSPTRQRVRTLRSSLAHRAQSIPARDSQFAGFADRLPDTHKRLCQVEAAVESVQQLTDEHTVGGEAGMA